jgi:phospholipid transport system substrate-binding protein
LIEALPIDRRRVIILAVAALLAPVGSNAAEGDSAKAQAVVDRLHETLLTVMKQAAVLKYAGRAALLAPVVPVIFDMPSMARLVIGTGWRDLPSEQQNRFVDVFTRFTIATYANRFDGWSGESFETLPDVLPQQSALMVQTRLNRTDGQPPVALNYLLRADREGNWRIIDVYLSGTISELATRRADYSMILKRDGIDKLIETIDGRIKVLAATQT